MDDIYEKFDRVNAIVSPADVLDFMGAELAKEDGFKLTYTCPYHTDDTPSLLVDAQNGSFNCFACDFKGRGAYSAAKYYLQFQNNSKPSMMMVITFMEEVNPLVGQFRYLFEFRGNTEYDFEADKRADFKNRFKSTSFETTVNLAKKKFTPQEMKIYIDAIMNNMPVEFIMKALKLEGKKSIEKGSAEFLALLGEED